MNQIFSLIGISTIVSGLVSIAINYLITLRQSKIERRIEIIQEKLGVYSFLIFHLDKMRLKGDALKEQKGDVNPEDLYAFSNDELSKTFEAVDSFMQNKFYLLNHNVLKEWMWIKTFYVHPDVKKHVKEFRDLLVSEYNITAKHFRNTVGTKWAKKHGIVKEIT